ncbi:MAG TPA: hypothetical protein VH325_15985 [Bryobacteraceae bacterium]|jgi:hypothetical protein|nr:hypothetical protein [Bryobacteraceae bacterium]
MSTSAQIAANQANAQQSTGPVTDSGKAASSQNRRTHGFSGRFALMTGEDPEEFTELITALIDEHQPSTATESMLVEKMAQHFWTARRATNLQALSFADEETHPKQLALYMRYETTHDRAFHKCLSDLLKLRAERRKALESEIKLRLDEAAFYQRAEDSRKIGFESQKQREADQARKQELHEARGGCPCRSCRLAGRVGSCYATFSDVSDVFSRPRMAARVQKSRGCNANCVNGGAVLLTPRQ